MSLDSHQLENHPVTRVEDLLPYFESPSGVKPELVGLEHEKLLFPSDGFGPVPYEGAAGIGAVFEKVRAFGWQEFREAPGLPIIAMTRGRATLSLEPGGQFELSGSPHATAREAHQENLAHLRELKEVVQSLGLRAGFAGYRPFGRLEDMPWMPKGRYQVMRKSLGQRGAKAHDMMLMTATGQVSLDYLNEKDCASKVTTAARMAPALVALYANSPFKNGEATGYQSFRSLVWNEVDPKRCGYPPCIVDGSFSFRAYTEWALDAPLLFLRRDGQYLMPALTFRELLQRGFEKEPARFSDWVDHLSTLFPEVRVKKVIEVRSADCVEAQQTGALAALMRGLLYDAQARHEIDTLIPWKGLNAHLELHAAAQRDGLEAPSMRERARQVVDIARRALERFDPLDAELLKPLEERAALGKSPARDLERTRQPVLL